MMSFQQRNRGDLPGPLTESSLPPVSSTPSAPPRSTCLGHAFKSPDSESCVFTKSLFFFSDPKAVIALSAGPGHPTPHPRQTAGHSQVVFLPLGDSFSKPTETHSHVPKAPVCTRHSPAQHLQWLPAAHLLYPACLPFTNSPNTLPLGGFTPGAVPGPVGGTQLCLELTAQRLGLGPGVRERGCSSMSAAPVALSEPC